MQNKKYSRAYIEITNICNRNCSFCPGTRRPPRRMTTAEFTHVATSLVGITEYLYLHVMGEPLTHPDLAEFIRIATALGFKVAVTTNGTLIKSRADELISAGVYKVNISVHSFEANDETAYQAYLSDLCDFADRASAAGVLTVLRLWNKGHDGGRNDTPLAVLQSRLPGEWKWGARGARIRHRLHLEYGDRFAWPDMSAQNMGREVFCYGLHDHFGILVDGSVIPCCLDREGDVTLGNIHTEPIRAILSSERAENIRRGFENRCAAEELCQKCGYARRFG